MEIKFNFVDSDLDWIGSTGNLVILNSIFIIYGLYKNEKYICWPLVLNLNLHIEMHFLAINHII